MQTESALKIACAEELRDKVLAGIDGRGTAHRVSTLTVAL